VFLETVRKRFCRPLSFVQPDRSRPPGEIRSAWSGEAFLALIVQTGTEVKHVPRDPLGPFQAAPGSVNKGAPGYVGKGSPPIASI